MLQEIRKMQNKPNVKLTLNPTCFMGTTNPSWPTSPHGSRATGHESRINMQNKPNLHTSIHKCLRNMDLQKYLHPALLVSTNNQSSIIDNQLKGLPATEKFYIRKKELKNCRNYCSDKHLGRLSELGVCFL